MLSPTVRHMPWNTAVEPVKWMPARSGWFSATSPIVARVAGDEVDHARRQARLLEQLASRSSC